MDYWDAWERKALDEGVEPELASLGRQILRDHAQHGLDPTWQLGSTADGPYMLALCLAAPLYSERLFFESLLCRNSGLSIEEIDAQTDIAVAERNGLTVERMWRLVGFEQSTVKAIGSRFADRREVI